MPKPSLENGVKRGRFKKGNPGGPGRGKGKRDNSVGDALNLIREAITKEELIAIIKRMVTAAKSGNVRAAQLLLAYKAGKPKETVEISGADGDAIKVDIGGDLSEEEIQRIAEAVSAGRGAVK